MVRTLPLDSQARPELPRILAIAAAIAVHAFAFLLLLIPMATPPLGALSAPDRPDIIWVDPIVVPPVEPITVPVKRQQETPPKTVLPRTPERVLTPVDPVIVDKGTVAADPVFENTPAVPDAGPIDSTPLSGVQLEYAFAPAPRYPSDAARAGAEGTVLLKILVGTDGAPLDVQVQKSSGNRSLDRAAREQVLRQWRFKPALRNGQPVQAYGMVPVVFSMQ